MFKLHCFLVMRLQTSMITKKKFHILPIDEKQEIYLYTFDKNGKRIDKQIIAPHNNGYK
jgi:hypothetical protein